MRLTDPSGMQVLPNAETSEGGGGGSSVEVGVPGRGLIKAVEEYFEHSGPAESEAASSEAAGSEAGSEASGEVGHGAADEMEETPGTREAAEQEQRQAKKATVNPKIYAQLEKQFERDGPKSIIKSLESAEKTLTEHKLKLQKIIQGGGYPSQVQSTIQNVERQIETLNKFIKDKGL